MNAYDIARILFALSFVFILLGGGAWAAKRLGLVTSGGFKSKRRLSLVEVLPIDQKRRAAIIRCDEAEHLIILNANSATIIARGIDPPSASVERSHSDTAPFKEQLDERPAEEPAEDANEDPNEKSHDLAQQLGNSGKAFLKVFQKVA
ncbi:MAG: hypothetical protein EVA70_03660 [Parvularculaceae bacterium]|nr:MAG: hypothetical protein EVA70_03660 [Parvularculaceae bacterium]